MTIRKAVILVAGVGTRLIPYSKEVPKEMLPIFQKEIEKPVLKPLIQVVYEQLYDAGIREYCFITSRTKRIIENHFTPDWDFVEYLYKRGKNHQAKVLENFYKKIEDSYIIWINQTRPLGTGHAIYFAKNFVRNEYFIAVAGDNLFIGENVPKKLLELYTRYKHPFLTVKRVEDPRRYGVVIAKKIEDNIYRAIRIEEKPANPSSNLANTSTYIFPPEIFDAIKETKRSPRGEIEITDSIQKLIDKGAEFYVYESKAAWIDAGTWDTYLKAIYHSLKFSLGIEYSRILIQES